MPRPYCPRCAYPQQSCLCYAISETKYQTQIVVLQHPDEVKHAKNTARLISLVAPATKTIVGTTTEDFAAVREQLQNNPFAVVLYPAANSVSLDKSLAVAPIDTLIIIDGTWRKAKKIWLSNRWLHTMRVCRLNEAGPSKYLIRSGSEPEGLASIEAAAFVLKQLGESGTDALLDIFMAMQANWPSGMRER